jgi:hypothetical protein
MSNPALNFKRRMLAKQAADSQVVKAAAEQTRQARVAANTAQAAAPRPTGDPALDFRKRKQSEASRRIIAEQRAKQHEAQQQAVTKEQDAFQLLLHQLDQDEKSLRELPRGKARDEMIVKQLLPVWRPEAEQYLASGENHPNPILVLVMIWCFNVAEIDFALRCAETALAQNQRMPERFSRSLDAFVADATLEWAQRRALNGQPYEKQFLRVAERLDSWPGVPDIVRIKYLKFLARQTTAADPETALALYRQAAAIDPLQASCKTAIAKLERQVAKAAEIAAPA